MPEDGEDKPRGDVFVHSKRASRPGCRYVLMVFPDELQKDWEKFSKFANKDGKLLG